MNLTLITAKLTKDPDFQDKGNFKVARVSLWLSRYAGKDANQTPKFEYENFDVEFQGKLADELMAAGARKGTKVFVMCEQRSSKGRDQSGQEKTYKHLVVKEWHQAVDVDPGPSQQQQTYQQPTYQQQQPQPQQGYQAGPPVYQQPPQQAVYPQQQQPAYSQPPQYVPQQAAPPQQQQQPPQSFYAPQGPAPVPQQPAPVAVHPGAPLPVPGNPAPPPTTGFNNGGNAPF